MCKESLEHRQCTTQKMGENRCRGGYHLRSTKLVSKIVKHQPKYTKEAANNKAAASVNHPARGSTPSSVPSSAPVDFHGIASFLEVMMRDMLTKMLVLPVPPPPPPPKGDLVDLLREALKNRAA
jgi:hypothetical protein